MCPGGGADRLEHRIHRPIADRRRLARLAVHDHTHGRGGDGRGAAVDVQVFEHAVLARVAQLVVDNRHQVFVEHFLLLVGHAEELLVGLVELVGRHGVAELLQPVAKAGPTRTGGEHHLAFVEPDVLGAHDLVGLALLEEAVDVDAGAVREGVPADDGLVGRHGHTEEIGHHLAGAAEFRRVDAHFHAVIVAARFEPHHHLFKRRVAGALADAVDGGFHLPGAVHDAGQGVGHSQAEVVVAVDADGGFVDVRDAFGDGLDQLAPLFGDGVAGGVGDVDHGGAGGDHGFEHLEQILGVGATGIFGVELYVVHIALGELHGFHTHAQDGGALLFERLAVAIVAELAHHVDVGRADTGVDTRAQRFGERPSASVYIVGNGARQRTDGGALDLFGDASHGLEVVRARNWDSRLR